MNEPTRRTRCLLFATLVGVAGCSDPAPLAPPARSIEIDPPALSAPAAFPFLAADGAKLWMTWIEEPPDLAPRVRIAVFDDAIGWSAPQSVVESDRLLVNWADFPTVAALGGGSVAVSWPERTADSGFEYGLRLAIGDEQGAGFAPTPAPHPERSGTEFGFPSIVPDGAGGFDLIWLDGREYPDSGRMQLMRRRFVAGSGFEAEAALDGNVCSCCNTDALRIAQSNRVAVAYRGRTPDEVRDILVASFGTDGATSTAAVRDDGWTIAGCPVNGPALAADDALVAVAWFTEAESDPRVFVAYSTDGGQHFDEARRVDDGSPLGRVDLTLGADGAAHAVWLEQAGDRAEIRWRRVPLRGAAGAALRLGSVMPGRNGGFPRAAQVGTRTYVAWTDPGPPSTLRLVAIESSTAAATRQAPPVQ